MTKIEELVELLGNGLQQHGYSIEEADRDTLFEAIFKTKKFLATRYLCSVITVPDDIDEVEHFEQLYLKVRKKLIKQYVKFPTFKDLGTYLVFICSHKFYEKIKNEAHEFKDKTGIHVNVILGTAFVDIEKCRYTSNCTWGLFYSGGHFKTIVNDVDTWSKRQLE